jgi:hypothetical protein
MGAGFGGGGAAARKCCYKFFLGFLEINKK